MASSVEHPIARRTLKALVAASIVWLAVTTVDMVLTVLQFTDHSPAGVAWQALLVAMPFSVGTFAVLLLPAPRRRPLGSLLARAAMAAVVGALLVFFVRAILFSGPGLFWLDASGLDVVMTGEQYATLSWQSSLRYAAAYFAVNAPIVVLVVLLQWIRSAPTDV